MRLFRLKQRKPSLLTLGDRARDARQWELASRFYRKALNQNPHNSPIWVQYGHALKESGELRDPDKLAQSEIAYRRSLSLDPRVADSYLQLGHVLKIQGKKEEASAAYLQAIALGSSWDGATMELANLGWSEAHFSELGSMLNTDVVPDWPASDPETVKGNEAISHSDIADLRGHDLSLSEPDHEVAPQPHDSELNDSEIISREFDREYYLGAYPDINPAVVDPLEHFCITGWREGRNPCDWFSTGYYLNTHWDVADSGINPFVHYLNQGRGEGCQIAGVVRDLEIDPNVSLVSDKFMLDILRFPSRSIITDETTFDPRKLDIHWVIPDYSLGQGGHMTIFRMVRWLEIFGHRCTIWINHPSDHDNSSKAFEDIVKHYQPIRADVHFVADGLLDASGDAVIATAWHTVQIVAHVQKFKDRFYFIQDYEPNFYPSGHFVYFGRIDLYERFSLYMLRELA